MKPVTRKSLRFTLLLFQGLWDSIRPTQAVSLSQSPLFQKFTSAKLLLTVKGDKISGLDAAHIHSPRGHGARLGTGPHPSPPPPFSSFWPSWVAFLTAAPAGLLGYIHPPLSAFLRTSGLPKKMLLKRGLGPGHPGSWQKSPPAGASQPLAQAAHIPGVGGHVHQAQWMGDRPGSGKARETLETAESPLTDGACWWGGRPSRQNWSFFQLGCRVFERGPGLN